MESATVAAADPKMHSLSADLATRALAPDALALSRRQPQPIWLVCTRRPSLAEYTALARVAAQRGQPATVIIRSGMTAPDFSESHELVSVVNSDDLGSVDLGTLRTFALGSFGLLRVVARWLGRMRLTTVVEMIKTAEAVGRGYWFARFLAARRGAPKAIAIADDRDIRDDAGLIQFARRNGIKTVTVNFGKSDARADFGRRAKDNTYIVGDAPARRLKAWMVRKAPHELFDKKNPVVFTPPGAFVVLWLVGGTLPVPWSYGGGNSDRTAVQNIEARDQLVAAGIAASRVKVTGQCTHDLLWLRNLERASIRSKLAEKYRLNADRPLLICSLPVLGEHNYLSDGDHRESTEFLLGVLARSQSDVLLSLHPRQSRERYAALAESHGASILDEPLSEVLPAADAFVAYSSTLEWAQLLGIPSVALEYFELGYCLFENMPGIVTVTRRADLPEALNTVLFDRKKAATLKAQTESVRQSNCFDGGASARVLDVILEAC